MGRRIDFSDLGGKEVPQQSVDFSDLGGVRVDQAPPPDPYKRGWWEKVKEDVSNIFSNPPTALSPYSPYPGMDMEAKSRFADAIARDEALKDQARAAAGYSRTYRALAPVAELAGTNVSGMEEAARHGDPGGVLGHATVGVAQAAAPLAGEAALRAAPAVVRAAAPVVEKLGTKLEAAAPVIGKGVGHSVHTANFLPAAAAFAHDPVGFIKSAPIAAAAEIARPYIESGVTKAAAATGRGIASGARTVGDLFAKEVPELKATAPATIEDFKTPAESVEPKSSEAAAPKETETPQSESAPGKPQYQNDQHPNNAALANYLEGEADHIESVGGDKWRVKALRDGAKTIAEHTEDVSKMTPDQMQELSGIGPGISGRLDKVLKGPRTDTPTSVAPQTTSKVLQEQFPGRKMVDLSAADQAKVRAAALQEETARLGAKSKLQVQRESAIDQANQIRAAKGLEPMPGGSAPQSPAEFIGAAQEAISPEEALLQKWYDTEQVRRAATGQPLLKPLPWAQPRQ